MEHSPSPLVCMSRIQYHVHVHNLYVYVYVYVQEMAQAQNAMSTGCGKLGMVLQLVPIFWRWYKGLQIPLIYASILAPR